MRLINVKTKRAYKSLKVKVILLDDSFLGFWFHVRWHLYFEMKKHDDDLTILCLSISFWHGILNLLGPTQGILVI